MFEKLVVVTRQTRLADLVRRYNTVAQARFCIEHAGGDFADFVLEDDNYRRALDVIQRDAERFDGTLKVLPLERSLVPSYLFAPTDIVVALGQDGLVANTAKYVGRQPLIGVNPDPARFDGILLPFEPADAVPIVERVLRAKARTTEVTLAEARLPDGRHLLGFNDLFIGAQTHVSARYRIKVGKQIATHSSSGVIVSTGAGSTGWLSSTFNMAAALARFQGVRLAPMPQLTWSDRRLFFVVREPFASRASELGLAVGWIEPGQALEIESLMPAGGAIFSDGMESDFLRFDAGTTARIEAAAEGVTLVVP
ncbi:MAG: NAD+ kinase [Acidobacteria bacterium]|nr:NAD+ kinase [Acidobacteriota bacterium]